MASSKVCPLCGRTYGLTMSMCPVDGRMLVDERGDEAPEDTSAGPIRLSQATEALLGNILEPGADEGEARQSRHRHDLQDEAQTLIGPPPGMPDAPAHRGPAREGVTETTVSSAYREFREVTLSKPLASLGKPAASLADVAPPASAASVAPAENAVTHPRLARVQRGQQLPAEEHNTASPVPGVRRADVFTNLDMEFGTLDADASDHEVTRKVDRRRGELAARDAAAALVPAADLANADIAPDLGEDLVDSEDTTVGPHRDEIADIVRPRQKAKARAAGETVVGAAPTSDANTRALWILAIVMLGVLAAVVWFMALT